MKTPENSFKRALGSRDVRIGLWLALADPYVAELCAGSGFDWLLIDGEHGPNDLRTMLSTLQAIAPYPVHPVVRIPDGNVTFIKQVLEIGATTLLVPMVESADEARRLVRAVRYPPAGTRGVGSAIGRSSRWAAYPDYLQEANDRVCLIVQVETVGALERVAEIATVEGVDGVFIGPSDLAASMNQLGKPSSAQVRATVEAAISRIVAAGKAAGTLCSDEALARHYMKCGATFVAVGVDATLLARATRTLAGAFKQAHETVAAAPGTSGY